MAESHKGIYEQIHFGKIHVTLREVMDRKGITRNKLSSLTGVKYDVVARYYQGEGIERVDLTVLAKFCFVLDCSVADLLRYTR